MVTIGEIEKRLKVVLFACDSNDNFIIKCSQREATLKRNIIRSFEFIDVHIKRPNFQGELNHWQEDKVERNIKNLIEYIESLYSKLSKDKIEDFCKNDDGFLSLSIDRNEIIFIKNSFFGSVITDILWASDISVDDAIKISKGTFNYNDLEKKLPSKLKTIEKEVLPFIKGSKNYENYYSTLKEAVTSFNKKLFKGSNLLIMISIEGLVRSLGNYLINKQQLDKSILNREYNSLDIYLRSIPWKDDFEIDETTLSLITGDFQFLPDKIEKKTTDIKIINLKTRLDFLRRRFKQDRDLILHGLEKDYGKPWHLYVNFSALYEVYLTIKYYEDKYK